MQEAIDQVLHRCPAVRFDKRPAVGGSELRQLMPRDPPPVRHTFVVGSSSLGMNGPMPRHVFIDELGTADDSFFNNLDARHVVSAEMDRIACTSTELPSTFANANIAMEELKRVLDEIDQLPPQPVAVLMHADQWTRVKTSPSVCAGRYGYTGLPVFVFDTPMALARSLVPHLGRHVAVVDCDGSTRVLPADEVAKQLLNLLAARLNVERGVV